MGPLIDEMDAALIRVLHSDGRAPWPKVANEIGCSPSTARRRFEAMHSAGMLRLIGRTDVARLGLGVPAMVQFTGAGAGDPEFLEAMRTRGDVRFLGAVVGSVGSVAEFVVPDTAALQERIGRLSAEFDVAAEVFVVMHTYTSGQDWLPEAVERRVDTRSRELPLAHPTPAERVVLELLIRNGRTSLPELAAAIGKSENTARRTMDSLRERELLDFRVLIEPEVLGFNAEFWVWLEVEPSQLAQVGEELARNQGTKYLAATAGRNNLVGQIVLPEHPDMYGYVTGVLGQIEGVRRVEIMIQTRTYKRVWNMVVDGRYSAQASRMEFLE
ncbi:MULTISPECIES: Lrp/AsnC family transcriptional regulator [Prauserella salsuginis group]|uniref:Lrp/AsnC family transcriptional regulator n=1 Tax=Prauserella salsuginis TaxID=387889 RepID=A0ABW6G184_9PSEU|nr:MULTISPECIES: Lrp/AsnC family transcriptional regulator [Prauserella salsuginis group]MCR3722111.1 DNA-binding transcriptional regulator, Lrp family [Prauserella flava]MCR3736108.1 DNA-binding transcriptional regulator, Lrp family [Prauserella salsuginis]